MFGFADQAIEEEEHSENEEMVRNIQDMIEDDSSSDGEDEHDEKVSMPGIILLFLLGICYS